MKAPSIAFVACLLAGCASGPLVETDRDPAVDLAHYRTYAWKQQPPIDSPLLKQRVVDAVDAELANKGWRQVAEVEAEVVLVGNVASREEASLDYFYDDGAWNSWNWRGYRVFGTQRAELRTFVLGTLVLDMFDTASRRAVWRGVAQGTVPESEARRTRDAMKAVHAMFVDFPPSAGASR